MARHTWLAQPVLSAQAAPMSFTTGASQAHVCVAIGRHTAYTCAGWLKRVRTTQV